LLLLAPDQLKGARVGDGDRDLIGDLRQEIDVVRSQRRVLSAVHVERADRMTVDEQREIEAGAHPFLHELRVLDERRAFAELAREIGAPLVEGLPRAAASMRDDPALSE